MHLQAAVNALCALRDLLFIERQPDLLSTYHTEWAQHSGGDDAKKRRQQMQKSTTINCPGLESIYTILTIELLERKTLSLKR